MGYTGGYDRFEGCHESGQVVKECPEYRIANLGEKRINEHG